LKISLFVQIKSILAKFVLKFTKLNYFKISKIVKSCQAGDCRLQTLIDFRPVAIDSICYIRS